MNETKRAEVDRLMQQEDVQTALQQTPSQAPAAPPAPKMIDWAWFAVAGLIVVGLVVLYYALDLNPFAFVVRFVPALKRLTIGGVLVTMVLVSARVVDITICRQVVSTAARYNLNRVLNLVIVIAVAFILLSVLFETWYTAVVSLGLLSLIVGFALQTPITSLIGWIYLLIRRPYTVGDRIKIGDAKGDVIDVSYLDTTLWEFGGPYLSTEHPSGRIIRFPNSQVLSQTIYNYSWPLFPYIWNEIKFFLAYTSDLEFVAQTMREVVQADLGEAMMERVLVYRELLAQTPVDQLQIQEKPVVHFRAADNTWLEAIVRYLVHPKESGRVKTRLIRKLLQALNAEPERVKFPKGSLR